MGVLTWLFRVFIGTPLHLIARSHHKQVVTLVEEVNRHYDARGKHL